MGLARGKSGDRFSATIWPGYVDAMTTLLMILMFVITIVLVVQSMLRDTVDRQEDQLGDLTEQVAGLTSSLSVTQDARTEAEAGLAEAQTQITDFETRVSRLIAAREAEARRAGIAEAELTRTTQELTSTKANLASREQALALSEQTLDTTRGSLDRAEQALTAARTEIDAKAEEARLAAARREVLEALARDLEAKNAETGAALSTAQTELQATGSQLTQAEQARLAEAAAAQALRDKLRSSEVELTAMTMSLEKSRKEAEETLTLLAAANAAKSQLDLTAQDHAAEVERQAALLAVAQQQLAGQKQASSEAQRRVALLNEQVAELNARLGNIQQALNISRSDGAKADIRLEELGSQLNEALLRASDEQSKRLALEAAERTRLEAEAADLARYRSEFFGRLSQILEGRQGVEVVGDRFVFQSEVRFGQGEATLSEAGEVSIARVATMLQEIAATIPPEIDWTIRVDGHTDSVPLSGQGRYRDNWELSQARALAVVRYMIDDLGFPADRLAPTGFADTRPVAPDDTAENRARNRRIELKLTER